MKNCLPFLDGPELAMADQDCNTNKAGSKRASLPADLSQILNACSLLQTRAARRRGGAPAHHRMERGLPGRNLSWRFCALLAAAIGDRPLLAKTAGRLPGGMHKGGGERLRSMIEDLLAAQ
jgi:hypothetical protein